MGLAGRVVDGNNLIAASIWTFGTNPWTWGLWDIQGGAVVASSTGQGVSSGNSTSIFPLDAKLTLNGTSARFEIPSENIDLSITTTSPGAKTKHGVRAYGNSTSVSAGYVDDFEITTL
jgi:hypothetical protein